MKIISTKFSYGYSSMIKLIVKTFLSLGSPRESNLGHFALGAIALPTELTVLLIHCKMMVSGIPGEGDPR